MPEGSRSMARIFLPASAKHAARLIAVVVFPTPPFWFAIAMILPIFSPFSFGLLCYVFQLYHFWYAFSTNFTHIGTLHLKIIFFFKILLVFLLKCFTWNIFVSISINKKNDNVSRETLSHYDYIKCFKRFQSGYCGLQKLQPAYGL